MPRKCFVMVAGPSAIGKSTICNTLAGERSGIIVLHNDHEVMHRIFDIVHLRVEFVGTIGAPEAWRQGVNAKADCDRLIRLHHRDFIGRYWNNNIILAEGFVYMLDWYRQQIYNGLQGKLPCKFDFHFVLYRPDEETRIARYSHENRNNPYFQSLSPEAQRQHAIRLIDEGYAHFEFPPTELTTATRYELDDDGLRHLLNTLS